MKKKISNYSEKLVLGMLLNIPFDGLQWEALYRAAEDLKIYKNPLTNENKIELKNFFENDLVNTIKAFNDYLDDKMEDSFSKTKKNKQRMPEKIKSLILNRISASLDFKDGIVSSLGFMSLPQNSKPSLKMLYNTCDRIWRVSGDQSTDFSFYTKRLILSGVYSSTLMYWIQDDTGDLKNTSENPIQSAEEYENFVKQCMTFDGPFNVSYSFRHGPSSHAIFHLFTIMYILQGVLNNPNDVGWPFVVFLIIFAAIDAVEPLS